jgi:hypothetical protein
MRRWMGLVAQKKGAAQFSKPGPKRKKRRVVPKSVSPADKVFKKRTHCNANPQKTFTEAF